MGMTTSTIVASVLNLLAPFIPTGAVIDPSQIQCLADNVYFESGVEDREGKSAVAHVTLNRVMDPSYHHTVCEVIHEEAAFSWYSDGKTDLVPLYDKRGNLDKKAVEVYTESVEEAVFAYINASKDPTNGATFYANLKLANPKWSHDGSMRMVAQIGSHTFFMPKHKAYDPDSMGNFIRLVSYP